jgi:hypothetical protein
MCCRVYGLGRTSLLARRVFLCCLDFLAPISNQQLLQGRSRSMEGLMSSNNSGRRITVLNECQHYIKLYIVAWKASGVRIRLGTLHTILGRVGLRRFVPSGFWTLGFWSGRS